MINTFVIIFNFIMSKSISLEKMNNDLKKPFSSIYDQDSVYENYVKIPQFSDSNFSDQSKPIKTKKFSRSSSAFFKKTCINLNFEKKAKNSYKTTPNNL